MSRSSAAWLVPLLVLAALALAGCGDRATADAGPPPGATSTTGVLRGVVVDDAIRPLGQASVTVRGDAVLLNTTTPDDGSFRFTGLEPGTYVVEVSKPSYGSHQQAAVVLAGIDEPELVRFQLVFEPGSVPYSNLYKFDGFYECGSHPYHLCSNINIATWIVVCAQTGGRVCPGNLTQDRSLFFQVVEPGVDFLQGELVWTPTTATGESLALLLGGGNEEELKAGMAPAYNATDGRSPLMLRISNHEGPDAWCREQETCTRDDVLNETGIGTERALLVQVATGPTVTTPLCGTVSPCATGVALQQPFSMFTTAFYGYEPPVDWLFAEAGAPPPPPA